VVEWVASGFFEEKDRVVATPDWAFIVVAPVVGLIAVMVLALFHEHGEPRFSGAAQRRTSRFGWSAAPVISRRSSAALLEEYLIDDQQSSPLERKQESARLLRSVGRASTVVLEEYLAERRALPAAKPVHARRPERPAKPVRGLERTPHSTRLVPLGSEVAIG
jgi:hypothetical protein